MFHLVLLLIDHFFFSNWCVLFLFKPYLRQGIPVAPLLDTYKGEFVGVLSPLDFILILKAVRVEYKLSDFFPFKSINVFLWLLLESFWRLAMGSLTEFVFFNSKFLSLDIFWKIAFKLNGSWWLTFCSLCVVYGTAIYQLIHILSVLGWKSKYAISMVVLWTGTIPVHTGVLSVHTPVCAGFQ